MRFSRCRTALALLIPSVIFSLRCLPAHSVEVDVASLVAACAKHRNGARLSADKTVLCFDGESTLETPLEPFRALKRGGTLVVRSRGGLTVVAMQMADILLAKNATVVIHDYCLAACANALFVATHETHVAEGAIVAWDGKEKYAGCRQIVAGILQKPAGARRDQQLARALELCRVVDAFYRKRDISDDFTIRPQTAYSRKMHHAMTRHIRWERHGIFWTWHPDNFGGFFKSKIVFRSFPEQEAVEGRLRHAVIYDPPGETPLSRPKCTPGNARSEACGGLRD